MAHRGRMKSGTQINKKLKLELDWNWDKRIKSIAICSDSQAAIKKKIQTNERLMWDSRRRCLF